MSSAVLTLVLAGGYLGVMFIVVRPWVGRVLRSHDGPLTNSALALVLVCVLASAAITDMIGLHAVFGAFLLGAMIPPDSKVAKDLVLKVGPLVGVLFLPAFFAFTGMRTRIGLLSGASDWWLCALIVAIASIGKFGGSFLAARFCGIAWRDSAAVGVLMNTRGLMELVVLNIGLDLGVIAPRLFAMYVLMALATTFATTPLFDWLMAGPEVRLRDASAA